MDNLKQEVETDGEISKSSVAESDTVVNFLSPEIVQPSSKLQTSLAKGTNLSEEDRAKISEMVKGLAKYREMDEDDFPLESIVSPKKVKKSPHKHQKGPVDPSDGSLHEYLKSEMDSVSAYMEDLAKKSEHAASANKKQGNDEVSGLCDASAKPHVDLSEFKFNFNPPEVDLCAEFERIKMTTQAAQEKPENTKQKQKKDAQQGHVKLEGNKANADIKGKGKTEFKDKPRGKAVSNKMGSYTQLLHTMGRPGSAGRLEDDGQFDGQFEHLSIYKDVARELEEADDQPMEGIGGGGGLGGKKKNKPKSPKKQQDGQEQGGCMLPRKMSEDSLSSSSRASRSPAPRKEKGQVIGPDGFPEKSKKQKKKEKKEAAAEKFKTGKKHKSDGKNWRSPVLMTSSSPVDDGHHAGGKRKITMLPSAQLGMDDETVVKVMVPKEDHKYIMGPQRVNLIEICNLTGVMIEVPTKKEQSEEIVLRGDKLQVGPALALMFSKSQQCKMEEMGIQARRPMDCQMPPQKKDFQNQKKGQQQKRGDNVLAYDFVSQNINQNSSRGQTQKHQHRGHGQGYKVESYGGSRGHFQGQFQGRDQQQGHLQGHMHSQHERTQDKTGDQEKMQKSQGKRQRKKKNIFNDYMSSEEISDGLKRGVLIQGPIRINPKQFEEAYVPHPDGKSDILIQGLSDRNRALNTDEVAVLLNEEGDWLLKKDTLQNIEETHGPDGSEDGESEVLIESEEIIEVMAKSDVTQPTGVLDPKLSAVESCSNQDPGSIKQGSSPAQKSKDGNNKRESARDKYTSLSEVFAEGSAVARRALGADGSEEARKLVQRTGKVVAIIEKKHSRACTGHIKVHNPDTVLFSPSDHRMPRLLIPASQCPKDFRERPEDHALTLYVARLVDWRKDSVYADGCLAKSLGVAGEIEPETEGMLIENGVDFNEFPQQAIDCLPATPWSIPAAEFELRRDYRQACVFTIDPATARDLDDALSCEELGDGRYRIGVHIADVSYFIPEESALDQIASLRATSVYLVHRVVPMLPRLLCEELCSLNPDQDRLTFSVEWIMNEDGEIEEEWFGRSVIRSCVKLTYDHAQGFIEQPDRQWSPEELPPISEGFSIVEIKSRILTLDKIAKNLRKARFDGGALRLDQVKLQFSLDPDTWMPNGYSVYQQRDSNRLVEEFMLLANMAVAHKIHNSFPDKALLRRHPEPQEKMIENLRDQCSTLGIQLDISSAGALQSSLYNYCDTDDYSQARMQVLVALCSKPMQNAKYFCTGCIEDESLYRHYALNVPLYTHFTSPIRRYPDVIVHRALGAALGYCDLTSKSPQTIHKLAEHCNDKKTAAKRVGDLSSELFFAVFVKTAGPLEEKAMVMAVFDKAFDIFVLKLGVSKRVYCNRLPIKEKIYKTDRKVPSLTLVWECEEGEAEVRQEITIFTLVDCVLEQGELPLQWTAVIKKPTPIQFPMVYAEPLA